MKEETEEETRLVQRPSNMGNQNGLTTIMATLIVLKGIVSTGYMTIPVSIARAGLIPSILTYLFVIALYIISYTKLYEARRQCRGDFLDVIEAGLGKKVRLVTCIFVILSHFSLIIAETSFILDNLPKIISNHTTHEVTKIAITIPLFIVVGVLTQFRFIKNLKNFYAFGVVLTALIIIMIFTTSIVRIANNGPADTSLFLVSKHSPTIIGKFCLTQGTVVFGFDFSPVILNVAINMKNPSKFPTVVNLAYVIAAISIMAATFLPYVAYGAQELLKTEYVTESIHRYFNYWYIEAIIILISIALIGTTVLLSVPLFYSVEGFFFPPFEQNYISQIQRCRERELPSSQNQESIFGKIGKYRTLIRALLVLLGAFCAFFLSKDINMFVSISQVLINLPLLSIIPILAHSRLVPQSKQEMAFNYLIIGITVVIMILTLTMLFL